MLTSFPIRLPIPSSLSDFLYSIGLLKLLHRRRRPRFSGSDHCLDYSASPDAGTIDWRCCYSLTSFLISHSMRPRSLRRPSLVSS